MLLQCYFSVTVFFSSLVWEPTLLPVLHTIGSKFTPQILGNTLQVGGCCIECTCLTGVIIRIPMLYWLLWFGPISTIPPFPKVQVCPGLQVLLDANQLQ